MRTINKGTAHKNLVTKHETMRWESPQGRLSLRKTDGRYVVRLEDYEYGKVTKQTFATLPGALVAAETLREYYL